MKKTLSLITMFSAITVIIFIAWCSKQKTVQIGDTVEIEYTATLPDGSIFKTNGETTLRFVVGEKEVIDGLDEGVIGMKLWKTETIDIDADKAYQPQYNKMKVQKIAKNVFEISNIETIKDQKTKLWDIEGVVRWFEQDEKWNEYVLLDINPPYTYETLTYKITIKKLEKKLVN